MGNENNAAPAIVNLFIPGVGQMMKGETAKGILFLLGCFISAMLMIVIIGFLLFPVIYIWSIVDAYQG